MLFEPFERKLCVFEVGGKPTLVGDCRDKLTLADQVGFLGFNGLFVAGGCF
jgi:hypothetical protein